MASLREAVIKLATDVPELRKHLIPLLRKDAYRGRNRAPTEHEKCPDGKHWDGEKCETVDTTPKEPDVQVHPSDWEDAYGSQKGRYQFAKAASS